jgi:hypothetical protein
VKQPKKRKAGRPPLPKGQSKAGMLRVRLTPRELEGVQSKAANVGQTVSDWVRGILVAKI